MSRQVWISVGVVAVLIGAALWVAQPPASSPPVAVQPAPAPAAAPQVALSQPTGNPSLDKAWHDLETNPGERVLGTDVTFTVTNGSQRQWEVQVEKAIYFDQQENGAELKGLKGTLYDKTGKPAARFQAPYGTYDQKNERFEMKGGVTVASSQQAGDPKAMALSAPTMVWSGQSPKIKAMGGVTLKAGNFANTTANQAAFSLDLSQVDLIGNTVSTLAQS